MVGIPLSPGCHVVEIASPRLGKHVVQLADAHGTVLDEIKIEVLGAGLKPRRNKPT